MFHRRANQTLGEYERSEPSIDSVQKVNFKQLFRWMSRLSKVQNSVRRENSTSRGNNVRSKMRSEASVVFWSILTTWAPSEIPIAEYFTDLPVIQNENTQFIL